MVMPMTEVQFQQRITDLCDYLALRWHHETDSRKSPKGWPDLVIGGPNSVIFAELKTEKGRTTEAQKEWLQTLARSGAVVYLWRPDDWSGIEQTLKAMAAGRATFTSIGRVAA